MSKQTDLLNLTDAITVDSSNNVGIGTSSPQDALHIAKASAVLRLEDTDTNHISTIQSGGSGLIIAADAANTEASSYMALSVDGSEAARLDSSGNLLVGMTSASTNNDGAGIRADGLIHGKRADVVATFNRKTTDGAVVQIAKDNTVVGSIGTTTADMWLGTDDVGLRFHDGNNMIYPIDTASGTGRDNAIDLGESVNRFDDIYATNGTIQTSDRNEKQDIAALTATEMLVAARISAMFKTFRWIDKVADNPNARTHTGIIAQDVQQAFTDEGLDAGDYSLFISTTWWETQTDVPAVAAVAEVLDDDGNVVTKAVEAKDAYTRTDTYDTQAEAPEGATERTRLGIRYPELLSFIAAYNEQRFTDIEARLTALETV